MSRSKLRWALGALLALTLAAALFAPQAKPDAAVLLAERPHAMVARTETKAPTSSAAAVRVLTIRPRDADDLSSSKVFAPHQWTPPPSPKPKIVAAAAPLPAPPPAAPPLPFKVLGRYAAQGQLAVFLQHNDQNLVVRVGDTIAEQYKVERLEGSTLTLRYLPLDQAQTLEVGAAQ